MPPYLFSPSPSSQNRREMATCIGFAEDFSGWTSGAYYFSCPVTSLFLSSSVKGCPFEFKELFIDWKGRSRLSSSSEWSWDGATSHSDFLAVVGFSLLPPAQWGKELQEAVNLCHSDIIPMFNYWFCVMLTHPYAFLFSLSQSRVTFGFWKVSPWWGCHLAGQVY